LFYLEDKEELEEELKKKQDELIKHKKEPWTRNVNSDVNAED
jgi:hypothetical protein